MSPRLFGTDGIRGTFGLYPLDAQTVRRLGRVLAGELGGPGEARVVIGGDTRASTPELVTWLAEGLGRAVSVSFLGTVPTPAVAHVTRALGATCGVAVSASHNPHPDNGIKLFDGAGFKWPPSREAALEAALAKDSAAGREPAELTADRGAVETYLRSLAAAVRHGEPSSESHPGNEGGLPLAGLSVAVDTGNGSASPYAEELFTDLGAHVTVINSAPDGKNINAGCGSTHPEVVAELTRRSGADVGFAFDGDADRVILADEQGEIRDGDAVLYLWGRDLADRGALPGRRLVATSMSNLGLEAALGAAGISLVRCDVGDRVVVDTMRREGAVLGGEQSGHVVNLELGTTGDGLVTALAMARLMARRRRPLSELLDGFERFPQLIENVRVREKVPFERLPAVVEARRRVEAELARNGRLVLRYSGTEPLARIMIEGRDRGRIGVLAEELAAVISTEIGE